MSDWNKILEDSENFSDAAQNILNELKPLINKYPRRTMNKRLSGFIISTFLFGIIFHYCSSPESSKTFTERAIIVITVDSTPILAIWNDNVNLWYLRPTVSINLTNMVSVNVTVYRFEFILNGRAGYEVQEGTGERLSPIINNPRKLYPQVNTSFYGYEKFRFTVKGTDDHGNNIDTYADFDVHYVE